VDPKLASYGTEDNPLYAIHELAQTTVRSEICKITLDDFNKEKNDTLPEKIIVSLVLLTGFLCYATHFSIGSLFLW